MKKNSSIGNRKILPGIGSNPSSTVRGSADTAAWKEAEWSYAEIFSMSMMPFFGPAPSPLEILERMDDILKKCPQFYPALLDAGVRRLFKGEDAEGKRQIDMGFSLMLELSAPSELADAVDSLVENIEKTWRFDISAPLLRELVKRFPENSAFLDALAHTEMRVGDVQSALSRLARAVEIAPEKSQLWSNLGWMQMIAGNIREARVSLEKALSLKPGDKIVEGNLRIHSYLARHGGNYFDYLLRPLDRNKIDKLATAEKWEEAEALCSDYNSCRIEAMAREILLNGGKDISFLPDTLSTLRCFFGFAGELNIEGCFLQEDLSFIASNFKSIMHKFIFKFADVDCGMIKEIYDALFRYYGFLAARGIVPAGNFRAFQKDALGIKAELIAKMEKYNVIRHADMPEKKRESLRGELFEDDHLYPHL